MCRIVQGSFSTTYCIFMIWGNFCKNQCFRVFTGFQVFLFFNVFWIFLYLLFGVCRWDYVFICNIDSIHRSSLHTQRICTIRCELKTLLISDNFPKYGLLVPSKTKLFEGFVYNSLFWFSYCCGLYPLTSSCCCGPHSLLRCGPFLLLVK